MQFLHTGQRLLRLYQAYGSRRTVLLLRCFSDLVTALYNTAVCSGNRFWGLQKQLDHNNLKNIFDIFIWSTFRFLCAGLYFALWCGRWRSDFYLLIRSQFLYVQHQILLNVSAAPLSCDTLMTVMTRCAFFNMHGCLLCVYTALVIHIPAIKHQHKAISQCNRFVSSPSRSPGGPIMGPSGPWRWFREKGGGKKQGVTGNC